MTTQPDVSIRLTDTEQPAAHDFISRKLGEFNHAMTGRADAATLDVVTDPATGEIIGGLTGRTSLGLFFIDLFYLPESLRGGGFGSRLLREAETEAKRRGCARAVLYTRSRHRISTGSRATKRSVKCRASRKGRRACSW